MESQARPGRKASVVYHTILPCYVQGSYNSTVSLPRKFPPPAFDHLQLQKWRGKVWESHVRDVR